MALLLVDFNLFKYINIQFYREEVKSMGHLSKAQRSVLMDKAIEIVKNDPSISFKRLSETIGLSQGMCQKWYADDVDGFHDRYHDALKYAFNRLEGLAIRTLGDLLVDGNFQATKYVLDNRGYKPVEKSEVDMTANIQIDYGDDDESTV